MTEAPRPRTHNLDPPASRFIGRKADLAAIASLFERGARLVTLWGPGGMGKTRLALEVAAAWAREHPGDAAWLCELASSRDLEAVCGAVARAIEAKVAAGKKDAALIDRIGRTLAAQGPALLVLDNLEQVLAEAAPALDRWVRMAPEVRFLVTSRERARLPGEVSYELAPLSLPAEDEPDQASEAVELFLDRVRGHGPLAAAGGADAAAVADLVRRLEGIPLAIELAAARADVLGASGLLARLGSRLALLSGGRRGVEARQATLRSAIEWSWDLLDDPERAALARSSAFRGGFSLEAAAAVLGEADRALDRVQSLRDKSLLRASPASAGGVRFSLYEGVRELAAEKLAERGEGEGARERHAAYYLAAGEAAAIDFDRTGALAAMNRIADDLENLLAVAEGALDRLPPSREAATRALRALLVIDPVLSTRGPFGAQLDLLDRALAAGAETGADPLLQARALAARGRARHLRGIEDAGLADVERARSEAAALGAREALAGIVTDLGLLHHRRRAMDRARACYEEALALHRTTGDRRAEGRVLGNLGALHHDERRFDEAMRHYEQAIAIFASIGDGAFEAIFSTNAGLVEQERGAPARARKRYEHAAAILEEIGHQRFGAITLGNLGMLHHEEGRLADARACHERAAAMLREVGDRRSEAIAQSRLGAVLASLDATDEARRALGRGERLLTHLGDEPSSELSQLCGGFLDLALGRAARLGGDAEGAALHLGAVRARIAHARAGDPSLADRSDDIRLTLRILERSLAALGEAAERTDRELLLSPEARWCRPPGGAWQDLRERQAVRRLLTKLVEQQRKAPGKGLSLAELKEAGWPGERILPEAASNRIYVAFNLLRKLGLKPWLRKDGDGYSLDPALPIHYVAFDPDATAEREAAGKKKR
jgi:predicted ATPase/Tfp pilus assembly protein PilF